MQIQSLLPLLAAIAYTPLLIIVGTNRPWHKHHLLFILFLITGMLWSISGFLLRSDYFVENKLLLFKLTTCFFLCMVVQFYYFVRFYTYRTAGWMTILGYVSLGVVVLGAALGYVPQGLLYNDGRVEPTLGWWVIPIVVIPVIMAITLVYYLIHRYKTSSDPIQRDRTIYLLITVGLLCMFGIINSATWIGGIFPTAQIGQLLNAALLTYATLKFRILDMNSVVRRSLVSTALIGSCLLVFTFWLFLIRVLFNLEVDFAASLGAAFLTTITVSFFWTQINDLLFRKLDALLYGKSYNHREELFDFVRRKIRSIFSLKELGEGLLPPLVKVLHCQQAFLLLPETTSGDFLASFSEPAIRNKSQFKIKGNSPIVGWLKQQARYLNRDTIDILPEFRGLWQEEVDTIKNLAIELLFPFISRGNLIGILALSQKESGKYSLEDANLVESIANQVAISLEKEYLQEELRKNEQELYLINRLALVITSSLNIQEVYEAFVTGLREVISVDFAIVALIEGGELCFSALSSQVGSAWKVGERIRLKGTATDWVIHNRKSLTEPDLEHDCIFMTGKEYLKHGIRSIVYLPLITKDEGIGSLVIGSRLPSAYTPAQVNLLERLASQISTSVANSQLYARAEQRSRIDELTGLYNRRHFDETLKHEVDRHSRYGSMISLAFLDLDGFKEYNDNLGHLAGDKLLSKIGHLVKVSVRNIDMAFRYGGDEFAIIMPHTSAENSYSVAERIRNAITTENSDKQVLVSASFGIASWPSDGLSTNHLINAADKALYHAKRTGGNRTCLVSQMLPLATEIHEKTSASEKETLDVIYALASTIEARDTYTYGHSQKVQGYAVALAEFLTLPAENVAAISHAALLHDIGKIGIYDEILNKEGKLDASEWELIKMHPQLSRTIVAHVSSLTPCLQAIHQHHERWDGKGYPNGLKGESISLEGRILAIADAFDAMTSKRPYRAPMSSKEAVQELKRCSGTQFDPALVEAFIPIALSTTPEEVVIKQVPGKTNID